MARLFFVSLFVLLMLGRPSGSASIGEPPVAEYLGACDASGAALLTKREFAVASDERTLDKRNVLVVYGAGEKDARKEFSLISVLKEDSGTAPPEADIEAAARVGSRIYWIASHGHTSKGRPAPGRQVFFATDVGPSGELTIVGDAYRNLVVDMANKKRLAKLAVLDKVEIAPESGGLNIEGLSATPDGNLLIGLRSPLHDSKAILIPLKNPDATVQGRQKAKLGKPIYLDLRGKGIRDIAYDADRRSFVVLAGNSGAGGASQLFRWSGRRRDKPEAIPAEIPDDFVAESLVIQSRDHQLMIFSDDGDLEFEQSDGSMVKNKELPDKQRRFRSLSFALH